MKYIKTGIILSLAILSMTAFVSCNNVLALGDRLDLNGPLVTIDTPLPREAVNGVFMLTGSVMTVKNDIERVIVKGTYQRKNASGNYVDTTFPIQWRCFGDVWEYYIDADAPAVPPAGVPAGTMYKTWTEVPPSPGASSWTWKSGRKSADWKVAIDMNLILGVLVGGSAFDIEEGQFNYSVTAWDAANNSDKDSYKTRAVIIDTNPPVVNIVSPFLYKEKEFDETTPNHPYDYTVNLADSDTELYKLHNIDGTESEHKWRDVQLLNSLMNGDMLLQYQIEAANDIWAFDIRFYDADTWSGDLVGDSEDYVYRAWINADETKPPAPGPDQTIKPNGSFWIPDLSYPQGAFPPGGYYGTAGTTGKVDYHHKKQITGKTTLVVMVTSVSASGQSPNQEDMPMGCFIYWPDSDRPWITFSDAMSVPYAAPAFPTPYPLFPSSRIPVRAFDDDGVDRVEFYFQELNRATGADQGSRITPNWEDATDCDEPNTGIRRNNGTSSFLWNFRPPQVTGIYKIVATVYDIDGRSETFNGYFEVLDISNPIIYPPEEPQLNMPMYEYIDPAQKIDEWTLDVWGYATAESNIKEVAMAWINPKSANYAAMSQLSYFRDPDYGELYSAAAGGPTGWKVTPPAPNEEPGIDKEYDLEYPNKVWNMFLEPVDPDPVTNWRRVKYHMTLNLFDYMDIAPGMVNEGTSLMYDYLVSQVFVLKVTDTNANTPKTSMLTWAPMGDTEAPTVTIEKVEVYDSTNTLKDFETQSGNTVYFLAPGVFVYPIDQFGNNDKIVVTGRWKENAVSHLDFRTILEPFLHVRVNDKLLIEDNVHHTSLTVTPDGPNATEGSWVATGVIRVLGTNEQGVTNPNDGSYTLVSEELKDSLVVTVDYRDIGGNKSEHGSSWLVQSDYLRFLRVGSFTPDGIYAEKTEVDPPPPVDTEINIFLEFSKPVELKAGRTTNPVLLLNVNNGAQGGRATYNSAAHAEYPNDGPSTRQHFTYKVSPGDAVDAITIMAIEGGDASFDSAGYPFTWMTAPILGNEEIRMVTSSKPDAVRDYSLHIMPTNGVNDLFTLMAGKHITIDTIPPNLSKIQPNIGPGYYGVGGTVYITLTFNESIREGTGAETPGLVLNIQEAGGGGKTTTTVSGADALVSDKSITFIYPIVDLDTTNFVDLQIMGITGKVYDQAGNVWNGSFAAQNSPNPLTGIRVHAMTPPTPTLTVQRHDGTNYMNVVSTTDTDLIVGGEINIKSVYYPNLYILVEAAGVPDERETIQLSLNGIDWTNFEDYYTSSLGVGRMAFPSSGEYKLQARQVDRAGNVSAATTPVLLNWDVGPLLQRINTTATNGIYTNTLALGPEGRQDKIDITLTFRKEVKFTANPTLTLSASSTKPPAAITKVTITPGTTSTWTATPSWVSSTPDTSFTFTYLVGGNDTTDYVRSGPLYPDQSRRPYLDVESMTLPTGSVVDEDGTDVTAMVNFDYITENSLNLQNFKQKIEIQTGFPVRTAGPVFENGSFTGSGATTVNQWGLSSWQQEDDSYWTTLEITFDKPIYRGTIGKTITIIQKPDGYRLPAVLTESQQARFRSAINKASTELGYTYTPALGSGEYLFDRFYHEGTNGFQDFTRKYILEEQYDAPTIDIAGTITTDVQKFANAFRHAEQIVLPNNSLMVDCGEKIPDKVIIQLTGFNALKVPAANYLVSYELAFVQDVVGNPCGSLGYGAAVDPLPAELASPANDAVGVVVSRPFVRVQRPKERYAWQTGTANNPEYIVDNWSSLGTAQVRMDCRTPGSTVRYAVTEQIAGATGGQPSVSAVNWGWVKGRQPPEYNSTTALPTEYTNGTGGTGTNAYRDPTRPGTLPTNTTGTVYTPGTPVTIGNAHDTNNQYQGYRWRVYARGYIPNVQPAGTTGVVGAAFTEEIVYRSVLTFQVYAPAGRALPISSGDQLWVRGGNTMTSTTIAGFPLTNDNRNWNDLSADKQRAGIRLMQKLNTQPLIGGTAIGNAAIYQWVTWDMNDSAFVTIYLGRWDAADNGSITTTERVNRSYQYGPMRFSSQVENWSMHREFYVMFPGGHRWLNNVDPDQLGGSSRLGPLSFNRSFDTRDNLAATLSQP